MAIMQEESRRGWRDPELVPLFAEIARPSRANDSSPWRESTEMQESLENMRRHLTR
jgi:hypothetical protein